MSQFPGLPDLHIARTSTALPESPLIPSGDLQQPHPSRCEIYADPLLTVEEVARRLKVSKDWVWDHSSRKSPHLPVIRLGDGALRFRASRIEEFISERERLSNLRRGSR
jgi:predicted DNA-binding transcriptional regulator AlpA